MSKDMEIARTIRAQLGSVFSVMTGAKDFTTTMNGLCFKLPTSRYMTIRLNGRDLYDIELHKQGRFARKDGESVWVDAKLITEAGDVSVDELHAIFTSMTGLLTSLKG